MAKRTVTVQKLSAGALGIPLSVLTAWGLKEGLGVDMPDYVQLSLGSVYTFLVSVLIPDHMEKTDV